MVVVSYSGKEINAKLVYYGPGLSGKTTNLEFIYDSVPSTHRGKMVSMKTRTERTLFFDFLPIDLGEMGGFKTRFLLYTVPGQVYYNATRKLVLRGVDAVVFVADSGRGKMNENLESLENLRENLREYGMDLDQMPWVMQYNKRDIPDAYTLEELNQALNPTNVPTFEAVATDGTGVFETFKGISKILLDKLSREIKTGPGRASAPAETSKARELPKASPAPAAPAAAKASEPAAARAATNGSKSTPPAPVPQNAEVEPITGMAPSVPETTSGDDIDSDQKVTLGQRIAKFFRKGPNEAAPPPFDTSRESSDSSRWTGPERRVSSMPSTPAPATPAMPEPVTSANELPVVASEPPMVAASEPPIAAPAPPKAAAVTVGTTRLARVDIPGETEAGASVIEKRIRVPVPVHLTPEEARNGVTLKLVVEIELTTGASADSRTGTD